MNKNTFQTKTLEKGEMHIYDFDAVRLHAYQTNDPIDNEVFIFEKNGKAVVLESPCFFDNNKELQTYLKDWKVEGMLVAYHGAGATFLPMVLMQMGNKDNPQRKQTMIMAAVMSVFMLWISWSSPAGVLLFWGASSLMGIAQQQISMRIMKKRDAEAAETIEVKPIEVDVTRKQKKPRPTKKDTTKRK